MNVKKSFFLVPRARRLKIEDGKAVHLTIQKSSSDVSIADCRIHPFRLFLHFILLFLLLSFSILFFATVFSFLFCFLLVLPPPLPPLTCIITPHSTSFLHTLPRRRLVATSVVPLFFSLSLFFFFPSSFFLLPSSFFPPFLIIQTRRPPQALHCPFYFS